MYKVFNMRGNDPAIFNKDQCMRFLFIVGHPQSFFFKTLQLCPIILIVAQRRKIVSHLFDFILYVVSSKML